MTKPSRIPTSPVSPRPAFNVALGLLAGLSVGLLAAVIRSQLDTRIRSTDELHALTGKLSLGAVPLAKKPRGTSSLLATIAPAVLKPSARFAPTCAWAARQDRREASF